jgi:hypothetical protein
METEKRLRAVELELRIWRVVAALFALVVVPATLAQASRRVASPGTSVAAPFRVEDARGRTLLEVGRSVGADAPESFMKLLDPGGHPVVALRAPEGEGGRAEFMDPGRPRARASLGMAHVGPQLSVSSKSGDDEVSIAHDLYGGPVTVTRKGKLIAGLGYDSDGGRIILQDAAGGALFIPAQKGGTPRPGKRGNTGSGDTGEF